MALDVTPITISATPSSAVATNGTVTFTYPSGYDASSFVAGGATLWSEGLETLFNEGASNFSVSYGALSATVTYLGSTPLPAGSALRFGPSMAPVVGVQTVALFVNLADIAANGDFLNYKPGYAFRVLGLDYSVVKPVTTASKRADFTAKVGSTATTGGVASVTSAAATPQGTLVAGSAITAGGIGAATDTLRINASNVTAHVEGNGYILLKLQNLDTYNETAAR